MIGMFYNAVRDYALITTSLFPWAVSLLSRHYHTENWLHWFSVSKYYYLSYVQKTKYLLNKYIIASLAYHQSCLKCQDLKEILVHYQFPASYHYLNIMYGCHFPNLSFCFNTFSIIGKLHVLWDKSDINLLTLLFLKICISHRLSWIQTGCRFGIKSQRNRLIYLFIINPQINYYLRQADTANFVPPPTLFSCLLNLTKTKICQIGQPFSSLTISNWFLYNISNRRYIEPIGTY